MIKEKQVFIILELDDMDKMASADLASAANRLLHQEHYLRRLLGQTEKMKQAAENALMTREDF